MGDQNPNQPQFLTVREAANRLRLHEITLRRLIGRGLVPSVKVGARRLIPSAYLDDIERNALAGMRSRVPEGAPVEQRVERDA